MMQQQRTTQILKRGGLLIRQHSLSVSIKLNVVSIMCCYVDTDKLINVRLPQTGGEGRGGLTTLNTITFDKPRETNLKEKNNLSINLLANLACNPEGPGFDVSDLEDPGRDSFVLGRLTLGLKRAAQSNFEEPPVLLCSFSLLLLLGLGLEAERERLALFWSFPCFTLAPGGTVEEAEATAEDEEEVEAAEEESVMALHPALAEVADFEASLVGFADLSSAPVDSDTEPLFIQELSVLFLF